MSDQPLRGRIITLHEWWTTVLSQNSHNDDKSPSEGGETKKLMPLLDLRSTSAFERERLSHPLLVVVSIPMEVLKERSFELPARHLEFSILIEESDLEDAQHFLIGRPPTPPNDDKNASRLTINNPKRSKRPWKVKHVLLAEDGLWEDALSVGILHTGDHKLETPTSNGSVFPLPRLWQPDPMVEMILLPLLQSRTSSNGCLQIWDLASGAGRDVAFLAEELVHTTGNPYIVCGIDHRYNDREASITEAFWSRRGLQNYTKCIKAELSSWETAVETLAPMTSINLIAALFCVRFWKPQLVSAIVQSPLIPSGTLFGLSHFCKSHDGASWEFDHPSEKTVLERSQLRNLFSESTTTTTPNDNLPSTSSSHWEILHDEIAMDSDHGRPMLQFVARKI